MDRIRKTQPPVANTGRTVRPFGSTRRRHGSAAGTLLLAALVGCGGGDPASVGETITLAEAGASNPTVAIAADGDVLVAWVGQGDSGSDVYFSRTDTEGSSKSEPVRVNDIPGDAHPHEQAPAQVALGPSGEVYVVWQRKVEAPWLEFGGADLRLARSTDGGRTFEPAVTVNDNDRSSPARISFHNLAVAPDGTVYVSWIDARQRDRTREEAYHRSQEGEATAPHVGGRHVHAADNAEPGTEIRVARSSDSGRSFGASVVVDHDSCPCCRTAVAIGSDGSIFTAWRKVFHGGIRDIAISRSSDDGRTFSPARPVHEDHWEFSACPHAGPSLAIDGEGHLHSAWYTGADGRQGLWYAASADGGDSFGAPVPILTDEWVPPSQARLAPDQDVVWVAWDDLREESRRVRLALIEGGRVTPLSSAPTGHSPAIAAANGRGVVAWLDGDAVRMLTFRRGSADPQAEAVALRE